MRRVGYTRYAAAGNDFGSMISRELGPLEPRRVVAIHVTQIMSFPSEHPADLADLQDLSDLERARVERLGRYRATGLGYGAIQATRPQTLSTARSAARLYFENAQGGSWAPPKRSAVPTGVAVSPKGAFLSIPRFARRDNTNVVHWSEMSRGGHSASLEVPELDVGDLRKFFKPFRSAGR
jgi:hypothetical protein